MICLDLNDNLLKNQGQSCQGSDRPSYGSALLANFLTSLLLMSLMSFAASFLFSFAMTFHFSITHILFFGFPFV